MRVFILLFISCTSFGQNTLGLIDFNPSESFNGLNLIYPENQNSVFLFDQCGRIVNEWVDTLSAPGKTAYLTKEGNLLKAKSSATLYSNTFGAGGAGGVVELRSWENDLLWRYIAADSLVRQHHDIHIMPNGNVLLILWERHNLEDIISNGFDTLINNQREIWSDKIVEINPETNEIVWQWRSWDHLVQDFDSTKLSYGDVSESFEKIDINYQEYSFERADWLHINSIDYHEELDHIILGVRNFQEIWIIDHSTTIEEASTSQGGNGGIGGDLLFRWGNPKAYKKGTSEDRQLFFQHDVQWVRDFVPNSSSFYNKVVLFNNFIEQDLSRGQILDLQWDETTNSYTSLDGTFLPETFEYSFVHPDATKGFSTSASSIQILPNDHILMCAARQGRSFEINTNGEIVWEYITPIINGVPAPQGTVVNISRNFTFQIERYPLDFIGFRDKDLTPGNYIELNPNTELCSSVSVGDPLVLLKDAFRILENPIHNQLRIESKFDTTFDIYKLDGRIIKTLDSRKGLNTIAIMDITSGTYIIRDRKSSTSQKIVLVH